jgi:hypothetical protein
MILFRNMDDFLAELGESFTFHPGLPVRTETFYRPIEAGVMLRVMVVFSFWRGSQVLKFKFCTGDIFTDQQKDATSQPRRLAAAFEQELRDFCNTKNWPLGKGEYCQYAHEEG